MALGDVTENGNQTTIELLASATAANSPPAGTSAGIDTNEILTGGPPKTASILVKSTAGSGTMTVTLRLWGYHPQLGDWAPLGTGGDSTKGIINAGSALGEVEANRIAHAEPIDFPLHFTRLYLEITSIGGTSTAVTAYLTWGGPS